MKRNLVFVLSAVILGWCGFVAVAREAGQVDKPTPFVLECYYKVKWGQAQKFLALYKKNHLPVMRKLQQEGRILSIEMEKPRYHGTEEGRWDYRVRLTFRDAAVAHDPAHEEEIKRELYSDQETFREEERIRFEILDAHWDEIIDPLDLDAP